MTTKELKQSLINNGLIIQLTSIKGEYRIINDNLGFYQSVRFSGQTNISPAYVKVLKYDNSNDHYFQNYTLDGFLKLIK